MYSLQQTSENVKKSHTHTHTVIMKNAADITSTGLMERFCCLCLSNDKSASKSLCQPPN